MYVFTFQMHFPCFGVTISLPNDNRVPISKIDIVYIFNSLRFFYVVHVSLFYLNLISVIVCWKITMILLIFLWVYSEIDDW